MSTPPSAIGVIIGTTRPGRFGDIPAHWILDLAGKRPELTVEQIDLRDYPLPLFEETVGPARTPPANVVARRWNAKLDRLDGYIIVTGEYNHGIPAALKNALDDAYPELNRKPVAHVGYGTSGGARAIEQLRLVCVELQMAPLRPAVHIEWAAYLAVAREGQRLADFAHLGQAAGVMLDDLIWWARTLRAGRKPGELTWREASRMEITR